MPVYTVPKIVQNEDLCNKIRIMPNSDIIEAQRKDHLGHVSTEKTPTGDILYHLNTLEPNLRSNYLANVLKTYQKDLGSSKLYYWYTAAAARQMWRRIRFSMYWTELFKDPKKLFVRDSQQLHKKFIWTILLTVSLSFWKFATLFKRVKNGKC